MRILFLFPYPPGQAPSQRFRFEQYFELLKRNGFQLYFQSFWTENAWLILYKPGRFAEKTVWFIVGLWRRLLMLFRLRKIDFVFIHRECIPLGPPFIEFVIAKVLKKKIVYDFDDAIWLPNTSAENRMVALLKWHKKVGTTCTYSHKISCGNSFLASYARNFNPNVIVNPTTIETDLLHIPAATAQPRRDGVTVGWTGTQSTLVYMERLMPVFEKLYLKFRDKIRLLIIANKNPGFSQPFVEFRCWNKESEIADLMTMDIGVMPLTDDDWSRGKCGFKALQYMALEIPAVVSPVGVNLDIIQHHVDGFHCSTEEEWYNCLAMLVASPELRSSIGQKGRYKVISHYSVSSNASNFLSLFS